MVEVAPRPGINSLGLERSWPNIRISNPSPGDSVMRFSVVIAYYRAAETIGTQLEALASQRISGPWEVVISDNESSDELKRIIRPFIGRLPEIRIADASDRRGEAHARNVGVESARGDVIAFCDADDEVGQWWLPAMDDALSKHDFVACRLDPKKLNPPSVRQIFGNHPQQWGLLEATYPPHFPHAGGGTLGFKRFVHQTVGGFDESWPVFTDTDFCFRARLAGIELHFVPDAVVYYRCRTSLSGLFSQARVWGRHRIRLYRRYRPPGARVSHAWKRYITGWDALIRSTHELGSEETRARWVWRLGWQIGQLEGSIRHFAAPV